jgi:hypothetical protein
MIPNDEQQMNHQYSDENAANLDQGSMDFSDEAMFGMAAEGGGRRRIDRNAMVLVLTLVAAVVGLWSMRTLRPTDAGEIEMASLPDQVTLDPIGREVMNGLVSNGSDGYEIACVRDPFEIWRPASMANGQMMAEEVTSTYAPDLELLCEEWRLEVDEIGLRLTLKSVLGGGSKRALVNLEGVLLALGDTFDIAKTEIVFTIEDTSRRSVTLGTFNTKLSCWHEIQVSMDGND